MKLCVCKNISLEQFETAAKEKPFEEAIAKLQLGTMCKTCLHQARYEYNKLNK